MADQADISQAESDFLLSLHLNKRTQYQGEARNTAPAAVIPAVRRRALPGVRYCVFCAEYHERTRTR